jgi:hypothetical protein
MKKSMLVASAAVAFAAVFCLAAFPAMAALSAPPYLADLMTMRQWALVLAGCVVFLGIVALGASVVTGQYARGVATFLAIIVGGALIAQATGLTAGLTGGL